MTQISGQTTQGYAAPTVTQYSVFLDNRVGKLHELIRAFEHSAVHVVAFSVHDASDHAVVRMVTSNANEARLLLTRHQYPFSEVPVLVFELDKTHTLERACMYLVTAELNIRFAYPLMCNASGRQAIAIAVDDLTLAGQILMRKEFRLMGEEELARGG